MPVVRLNRNRNTGTSIAREALRLLLERSEQPVDSAARVEALVLGAFQREVADAVGDDVDDAPAAVGLMQ